MDELPFSEIAGDEEPAEAAPTSRAQVRKMRQEKARKVRRIRRGRFIVLAFIVVLVGGGLGGYYFVWPRVEQLFVGPKDYSGQGTEAVEVSIVKGDTGRTMADKLLSADVVASTKAFVAAFDENPDSNSIQPGIYRLKLQIPAKVAVEMLLDPANVVSKGLTVADGSTVEDVIASAVARTGVSRAEFDAVLADPSTTALPDEAQGSFEGWLAPAIYPLDEKPTAAGIMSAMVSGRVAELTGLNVPRDQWRDLVIKSSITEKEVKTAEDKSKVSQAIDNRLAISEPLATDAIVNYGATRYGLTFSEVKRNVDNPYASYVQKGYPPTAIANPSLATITAVLNPTPGDWLFWCTINLETGETRFADTFAEHDKNVELLKQYIKERDLE